MDRSNRSKCLIGPSRCVQEIMSCKWHSIDIIVINEGGRTTLRCLYNLLHKYLAERCKWQENAIQFCAVTTFPLWFTTIECNCLTGKLQGICGPNSSISAQIFTPIAASIGTLWAQQWERGDLEYRIKRSVIICADYRNLARIQAIKFADVSYYPIDRNLV